MITMIRDRIRRRNDWNTSAAKARPGEVWTASYTTRRAVDGGRFESHTAGPVRISGDESAIGEYSGMKCLGQYNLDLPGFRRGPLSLTGRDRFKVGDVAPSVKPGTGEDLLAVPFGQMVTVEHRSEHPAYAGVRFVEVGRAGEVEDDDGEIVEYSQGPGRYVGDTWVRLCEVTGVQP